MWYNVRMTNIRVIFLLFVVVKSFEQIKSNVTDVTSFKRSLKLGNNEVFKFEISFGNDKVK